jgi:hypothetical protein
MDLQEYVSHAGSLSQPLRTALQARRTALQRDIVKWSNAQGEYMPHIKWARSTDDFTFSVIHGYVSPITTGFCAVVGDHANNDLMDVEHVELVNLWLPSDVPNEVRHLVVIQELIVAEFEVLQADLHDCLVSVRRYRRLYIIVRSNTTGDWRGGSHASMQTRKRKQVSGVGEKIETSKIRYQNAWLAATRLAPDGPWAQKFCWLEQANIRGPNVSDDISDLALSKRRRPGNILLGQGTYESSWIWRICVGADEPENSVRVQYAKTLANAERWEEELILVPEEMRRTMLSFEHMVPWWSSQVNQRPEASAPLQDALAAHARREATIYQEHLVNFATTWLPELREAGIAPTWTSRYNHLVPPWAWTIKRGNQRHRPGMCIVSIIISNDLREVTDKLPNTASNQQFTSVIAMSSLSHHHANPSLGVLGLTLSKPITAEPTPLADMMEVCDAVELHGAWEACPPESGIPDAPRMDDDGESSSDSDLSSDSDSSTSNETDTYI